MSFKCQSRIVREYKTRKAASVPCTYAPNLDGHEVLNTRGGKICGGDVTCSVKAVDFDLGDRLDDDGLPPIFDPNS